MLKMHLLYSQFYLCKMYRENNLFFIKKNRIGKVGSNSR